MRLPKRRSRDGKSPPDAEAGARLVRAQSFRAAIIASLIVIIVFSVAWAMLSAAVGRVFPWMTLVLGLLIGLAVRRAGRGLDWRFPTVAAVAAVIGALIANVVIAASTTAAEYGTGTLTVLRAATAFTWPVFFDEVMNGADFIYALFAAGIAAFYANRRLTQTEYSSYRLWRESRSRR